jgi:hypothetical protein
LRIITSTVNGAEADGAGGIWMKDQFSRLGLQDEVAVVPLCPEQHKIVSGLGGAKSPLSFGHRHCPM